MTTDLLIVGAGPAGVSAALWARTLHLGVVLIESAPRIGGQLQAIHFEPRELPGIVPGDGASLAERYQGQLAAADIAVRIGEVAAGIEADRTGVIVRVVGSQRIPARALLIATGLRRRRLEVPGAEAFVGRGVSTSSTRDRAQLAGSDVVVVGSGDAAFENALLLAEVGCRVGLIVRGSPRARPEFRRRVAAEARIEVLEHTRVLEILGDSRVRAVKLEGPRGPSERQVAGVVIKIGAVPNTEWCADAVACDAAGYVIADARGRTSLDRVWAAGDVTRPALPSLSVACGTAALAVANVRATLDQPRG